MLAYTIVSRAYVAHARVLARSYALHHPGAELWALLIDDVDEQFSEEDEPFRILRLTDLNLEQAEIHRMALLFANKLIAVIKPWVFEHFLSQGEESVLYIDGDMKIYDSLDPIAQASGDRVILVPHLLKPLPRDGCDPSETALMGAGMFNAGMFGVGQGHGGFIEFLQDRLRRECIFDAPRMRFNEQRWLDFVPSLFPHHIVRDPGVDVAYWNLHERPLEKQGTEWLAGGGPLRAFHYSSFDPRTPGVAGRFELDPAPRVRLTENPLLRELCESYASDLVANGFSELHDIPFSFDTLADGSPVYQSLRTLFTDAVLEADRNTIPYPPDPFDPSSISTFREWFMQRYEEEGLPLPLGLAGETSGGRSGVVARLRRRFGPSDPSALPAGGEEPLTLDWLDRMIIDEAAQRGSAGGIRVCPERAGFVCHGPRAPMSPGRYSVTLEWDVSSGVSSALPDDLVLVVEAFVQGYVVGSRAVSLAEILRGAVVLSLVIPTDFLQEALLFGLELRVLSRGGLDARLSALVIRALDDDQDGLAPSTVDWLAVMAGGDAGLRSGHDVVASKEKGGTVVSGPNWRLPAGSYRVDVRTHVLTAMPTIDGLEVVATVEVDVGGHVLASSSLTYGDLKSGGARLGFEVTNERSGPNDQVGLRFITAVPLEAVVTGVDLEILREGAGVPVSDG